MDFAFTPEQDALREQAREFLAANPEPTWQQLADLGWTGVSVAEAHGGAGLGFLDAGTVTSFSETDGFHLDASGHEALGRAVAEALRAGLAEGR